jgi:CDP-6-deoxy-D-xylo-4-hexulose-3-dehydrase
MTREASSEVQEQYERSRPVLNPLFTFAVPGYNFRNQEINAVLGLSQLGRMGSRLEYNVNKRRENFKYWLDNLDSKKFFVNYEQTGNSNFALPLILKEKDLELFKKCCILLDEEKVEYRVGTAGGGNQARQPYLEKYDFVAHDLSNVDHIHDFGLYIGNHPKLSLYEIGSLTQKLNGV